MEHLTGKEATFWVYPGSAALVALSEDITASILSHEHPQQSNQETFMTLSETPKTNRTAPSVAMPMTARNDLQIARSASNLARRLADELRGGKKADRNVTRASAVATDLETHLLAIQHSFPLLQNSRGEPADRPDVLQSDDLPTIIGAASSDARYIKRLMAGGMGMSRNVVEPLRVLGELRRKLAFIQDRWPEMQSDDFDSSSGRMTRHDKILQELIASGEVNL